MNTELMMPDPQRSMEIKVETSRKYVEQLGYKSYDHFKKEEILQQYLNKNVGEVIKI